MTDEKSLADDIAAAAEEAKQGTPEITADTEPHGEIASAVADAINDLTKETKKSKKVEEVGKKFSGRSKAEIQKAIDALTAMIDDAPDTADVQSDDATVGYTEGANFEALIEKAVKSAMKKERKAFKEGLQEAFETGRAQGQDDIKSLRRKSRAYQESKKDEVAEDASLAELLSVAIGAAGHFTRS